MPVDIEPTGEFALSSTPFTGADPSMGEKLMPLVQRSYDSVAPG